MYYVIRNFLENPLFLLFWQTTSSSGHNKINKTNFRNNRDTPRKVLFNESKFDKFDLFWPKLLTFKRKKVWRPSVISFYKNKKS